MKLDDLIDENNNLVSELDEFMNRDDLTEDQKYIRLINRDKEIGQKHKRYEQLQNHIKLAERANRNKEKSKLRAFITQNKDDILEVFNNECEACGFDFIPALVVHHKLPISEGGSNGIDNLSSLCPTCHKLVHYIMRTKMGERKEFNEWIADNVPENQGNKLLKIAYNFNGTL